MLVLGAGQAADVADLGGGLHLPPVDGMGDHEAHEQAHRQLLVSVLGGPQADAPRAQVDEDTERSGPPSRVPPAHAGWLRGSAMPSALRRLA